jgi:hypothetical protein
MGPKANPRMAATVLPEARSYDLAIVAQTFFLSKPGLLVDTHGLLGIRTPHGETGSKLSPGPATVSWEVMAHAIALNSALPQLTNLYRHYFSVAKFLS